MQQMNLKPSLIFIGNFLLSWCLYLYLVFALICKSTIGSLDSSEQMLPQLECLRGDGSTKPGG
jgi:hypothetical protein